MPKLKFTEPFKVKNAFTDEERLITSEKELQEYLDATNQTQVQYSLEELERKDKALKERQDKEEFEKAKMDVRRIKFESHHLSLESKKRVYTKDLRNLRGIKRNEIIDKKVRDDIPKY